MPRKTKKQTSRRHAKSHSIAGSTACADGNADPSIKSDLACKDTKCGPGAEKPCNATDPTPATERVCASCNAPSARFRCSKCKDTHYCSRECQSAAWREHKKVCVARKQTVSSKSGGRDPHAGLEAGGAGGAGRTPAGTRRVAVSRKGSYITGPFDLNETTLLAYKCSVSDDYTRDYGHHAVELSYRGDPLVFVMHDAPIMHRTMSGPELFCNPAMPVMEELLDGFPWEGLVERSRGREFLVSEATVSFMRELGELAAAVYEAGVRRILGNVGTAGTTLASATASMKDIAGSNPPIFIIGMPRTGTSLLHKLLSLDPAARAPLNWEYHTPSSLHGSRAREVRAQDLHDNSRGHPRHTEMAPDFPAEELILFDHLGWGAAGFLPGKDKQTHLSWCNDVNVAALYRLHKVIIRLLESQGHAPLPSSHWVFKDPRTLLSLPQVLEIYPNARFVWTHRPLREVFASNFRARNAGDAKLLLQSFHSLVKDALKARDMIESRDAETGAATSRFVDVFMQDILDDPVAAVRKIYSAFGLSLTDEYVAKLSAWEETNSRSPVDYSSVDLPYEAGAVTSAFYAAGYVQRFPGVIPGVTILPSGLAVVNFTTESRLAPCT